MQQAVVRTVLKFLTALQNGKQENLPGRFQVFYGLAPDQLLWELGKAYQKVFSGPPWREEWALTDVFDKLSRELRGECFLVIMTESKDQPVVAGFSWGRIVEVTKIEAEVESALGAVPEGLFRSLWVRGVKKVLYFHEFAILKEFRGEIDTIRFLLRPGLEMGERRGVNSTLFWSTPDSKIVPLALYMGYEQIFRMELEPPVVFLYNPDFGPLLKVTQVFSSEKIAWVMRSASRFLGTGKRK